MKKIFGSLALFLSFSILTGFPQSALGKGYPDAQVEAEWKTLALDLAREVNEFDGVRSGAVSQVRAKAFAEHWKAYVFSPGSVLNPTLDAGTPWSGLWPGPAISFTRAETRAGPRGPPPLTEIPSTVRAGAPHSLPDPLVYAENRLGKVAADEIRSGRVQAVAYAGDLKNVCRTFQISPTEVKVVPSLYASWGIQKVLIPPVKHGAPARLVFVIPPIEQYAQHYRALFDLLDAPVPSQVILSSEDRVAYLKGLREDAATVLNDIKGPIDFLILGYMDVWKAALSKPGVLGPDWVMDPVRSTENSGVSAHVFHFKDRSGSSELRLVSLGSSRTLWGEASAALVEGALPRVKGVVLFGGSAGGVSNLPELYGVSIPKEFRVNAKSSVTTENWLLNKQRDQLPAEVPVKEGGIHGNSFSPAQQTLNFTDRLLSSGVDTVDVEQSLIARSIAGYNRTHGTQIEFGAANLITDLPANSLRPHLKDFHLDQVAPDKKRLARSTIVQVGLAGIEEFAAEKVTEDRCAGLLKPIQAISSD